MRYLTLFPNLLPFKYSTKKAKFKAAKKTPCAKMKEISIHFIIDRLRKLVYRVSVCIQIVVLADK